MDFEDIARAKDLDFDELQVIDGKIVTLNEVNDEDESILADEMVQHTWYTVKYDADGNVKSIDKFDEAAKYADDMVEAVNELRDEDLVVMQLKGQAIDYSKNGRSVKGRI